MANVIYSIRPLNDGTKGFRFDVIGFKGVYRKRVRGLRAFEVTTKGKTFVQVHKGKHSLYIEQARPLKALADFSLLNRCQYILANAKARVEAIRHD